MKTRLISLLLLIFLGLGQNACDSQETSTYYLIRHAEKDRTDPSNKNPHLTEAGHERALKWKKVLSSIEFDHIYSTDYHRTIETVTPIAEAQNLDIEFYNPSDMFDANFKTQTKGKVTLISGHSNTTPFFANRILQEERYEQIDDSNNANLYIVEIRGEHRSAQLLHIE